MTKEHIMKECPKLIENLCNAMVAIKLVNKCRNNDAQARFNIANAHQTKMNTSEIIRARYCDKYGYQLVDNLTKESNKDAEAVQFRKYADMWFSTNKQGNRRMQINTNILAAMQLQYLHDNETTDNGNKDSSKLAVDCIKRFSDLEAAGNTPDIRIEFEQFKKVFKDMYAHAPATLAFTASTAKVASKVALRNDVGLGCYDKNYRPAIRTKCHSPACTFLSLIGYKYLNTAFAKKDKKCYHKVNQSLDTITSSYLGEHINVGSKVIQNADQITDCITENLK